MSAPATAVFYDITPYMWSDIQKQFQDKAGVDLSNNSGEVKTKGIDFIYSYIPDKQTLTVTINSTPFLLSKSHAIQLLTSWIQTEVEKDAPNTTVIVTNPTTVS